MARLERVTIDPGICHGQPTIRGLRYPVESLLQLLASGMTIEQIIADHPDLEREDLLAASGVRGAGCRRAPSSAARRSMRFLIDARLPLDCPTC